MKRCVIYARYSCDHQREESIEGQLRECREFCNKNNLTIKKEYIDRAFSAKTDNRPSFLEMIKNSELKNLIMLSFGNLTDSLEIVSIQLNIK